MWKSYPNARTIDISNSLCEISLQFSTINQQVYEVNVSPTIANPNQFSPYRWRDEDFRKANDEEAIVRNVDNSLAWDDVKYIDLDLEDDLFDKIQHIWVGEEFDERVLVEVDMPNDIILWLALEAHKKDITINRYLNNILEDAINKLI